MKKFLPVIIVVIVFLGSCKNNDHSKNRDKKYGGTLRIDMASVPKSLYPQEINDIVSSQIASQIHAGLVKFNAKNLAVMPAIARRWKADSSNTVFTFHLRSNAFFHDDPCFSDGKGRKITATDFKFSLEQLCRQDSGNVNFNIVSTINGAKKYFEESKNKNSTSSVDGIKIINDSTLEISIEKSNPYFVNFLANPVCCVLPKEAVAKYGKNSYVGAGPFKINNKLVAGQSLILTRSENYFLKDDQGLQLPYLDSIQINFVESSQKEFSMFFNGNIDLIIGLNQAQATDIMEKHVADFEKNPPLFNLNSATEENEKFYNLLYPYVKEFYSNSMHYVDLSGVYFEKTTKTEPTKSNQ